MTPEPDYDLPKGWVWRLEQPGEPWEATYVHPNLCSARVSILMSDKPDQPCFLYAIDQGRSSGTPTDNIEQALQAAERIIATVLKGRTPEHHDMGGGIEALTFEERRMWVSFLNDGVFLFSSACSPWSDLEPEARAKEAFKFYFGPGSHR